MGILPQISGMDQLVSLLFGDLYQWIKKRIQESFKPGMYEVLDYQTTLEIRDPKGKRATLSKIEKVRFLQDNIISYQDQAWGDGKILQEYQCSPGIPVDKYRSGHNTLVLISLRGIRNKGDIDEFRIDWKMKNVFLKQIGFWETSINHKTNKLYVNVIFPYSRPPRKCSLLESNNQRNTEVRNEVITQLPDKRWQLTWKKSNPLLHERYILNWVW